MANIILTTDMFKAAGFDNLALDNTKTADLQAVISEWEKYYIYQMLSNNTPITTGLADLFSTECAANSGVPTSSRFLKIFNPFNEQVGGKMWSSKGMIQTLKSIIAYHYVTEVSASWVGTGGVSSGNSTGSKTLEIANAYRWAESRFNDALASVKAIQWWLASGNGNGGGQAQYPEYVQNFRDQSPFRAKYQSVL